MKLNEYFLVSLPKEVQYKRMGTLYLLSRTSQNRICNSINKTIYYEALQGKHINICFKVAESRLKTYPFTEEYMDTRQQKMTNNKNKDN